MLAPALTILLSSFLLFLVQPIIAKQILPWFGGSSGVWTVCLVFFQMVLLLGYAYAHWLARRRAESRYLVLHILLLLVSCLSMPIIPATFWKPSHETEPVLHILGLLAATVGLPYFLLASTAPLLQYWLCGAANSRTQGRSIYRLFALSNFGSIVGLLSYPFAIEPFVKLNVQAWVWSSAYALYAICSISYTWHRRGQADNPHVITVGDDMNREVPPSLPRYLYWIGCAALGSALLLSVSNQITQNIASIPFLWIVPLTLYLLSFIVCFEGRAGRGWYERHYWMTPAMLTTGATAWILFAENGNLSIYVTLPIYFVGLFLGCVLCHGEMARSKPHPEYLTHFYLTLASGGALGGLLVGLVAPLVFSSYWEMPLVLIGLAVLGVHVCAEETRAPPTTSWMSNLLIASCATVLILLLLGGLPSVLDPYTFGWSRIIKGDARWGCAALLALTALLLQRYRLSRAIGITALFCTLVFDWSYYHGSSRDAVVLVRNFYGTLRVTDSPFSGGRIRRLMHGVILHGSQIMDPGRREMPTSYYGESSGIGRTILFERTGGPLRIGSIGLGAGTLASYGRPGDLFRVYELNPVVLDIAQRQFTFLKDSKAQVEPVLGDARLSLELEIADGAFGSASQRFDILSIDAFSGDAIPLHLLTREAFAIYARAIKPDGIIIFHLSNQYLELAPVVEHIARDAGFQAALVADRPRASGSTSPSDWVLVTRNATFLQQPAIKPYITPIMPRPELALWTDQFSNLFQILK
jgi:SAM-dependent methyltransferase